MIWDSEPWRNNLLASARYLTQRAKAKRITGYRSVFIERAVFFAAYVMRKLDDSHKLSSSWRGTVIKCTRFPPIGRRQPSLIDWHKIDQHYDLDSPHNEGMSARDFCDLVVHSFIFLELVNDDRSIYGFLITSDRLKGKGVWRFGLDAVIALMVQTAGDWPVVSRVIRNPETGETIVWTGNREPPKDWTKKADKLAREWASKLMPTT